MNPIPKSTLLAVLLTGALTLSGCIAAIGNRGPLPGHSSATLGQELIDLKKAFDSGALTEAEYKEQHAKLLNRPATPAPTPLPEAAKTAP